MKRTGIVKAVSKKMKDGALTGKNAFTLTDGKKSDGTDIWFNGDGFDAEKGDTIEFDVDVNGIWHNFSNVKILAKSGAAPAIQQVPEGQPLSQRPMVQPTPTTISISDGQSVSETGIAFIELYGQKYKITLERSA